MANPDWQTPLTIPEVPPEEVLSAFFKYIVRAPKPLLRQEKYTLDLWDLGLLFHLPLVFVHTW